MHCAAHHHRSLPILQNCSHMEDALNGERTKRGFAQTANHISDFDSYGGQHVWRTTQYLRPQLTWTHQKCCHGTLRCMHRALCVGRAALFVFD